MAREDDNLIRQLADSFGMTDLRSTKYGESHYDPATGTLYCDGLTIPKVTVERALENFRRQKDYYHVAAQRDPNSLEQYLMNVVAHNAILMLISNIDEKR